VHYSIAATPATPPAYDGQVFSIANQGGLMIDVLGGSKAKGAKLWLYSRNGTQAQQFKLEYVQSSGTQDYYYITNPASGLVLDVKYRQAVSGTSVWLWERNGKDGQLWEVIDAGNGAVKLRSKLGELDLGVGSPIAASGSGLQILDADADASQLFYLEPASILADGAYSLGSSLKGGMALGVQGSSKAKQAGLQLQKASGSSAQRFTFAYDAATGYYSVVAACSGLNIDVAGGYSKPGSKVWQWEPNSSPAQMWRLIATSNPNEYIIIAATGAGALDVQGGYTANGTPVWTYAINGTAAQRWVLTPA
jgi:hypothetical protein